VKRFLAALLAGWQQALDPKNQEEAIKTLQKYDPDTPRSILEEQLKITRELIQPNPALAIGTIDEKGWEQTERIMRVQKQLPVEIDIKTILKPVGADAE
jgi:NitT/TauT family transport system substrate-binding protein